MFSGKTEELIRRLKRSKSAHQRVEIFKPVTDVRYHETNIVSHDENFIRSTPVQHSQQILLLAGDNEVIGIDEAQFFDLELPVCIGIVLTWPAKIRSIQTDSCGVERSACDVHHHAEKRAVFIGPAYASGEH